MSFKVIQRGTNRKVVYDFLLVVYSKFCRIAHCYDLEICPRSLTVVSRESCRVAMYVKCSEDMRTLIESTQKVHTPPSRHLEICRKSYISCQIAKIENLITTTYSKNNNARVQSYYSSFYSASRPMSRLQRPNNLKTTRVFNRAGTTIGMLLLQRATRWLH